MSYRFGGDITGICGRPVFRRIGESAPSASSAPLPPNLPRRTAAIGAQPPLSTDRTERALSGHLGRIRLSDPIPDSQ